MGSDSSIFPERESKTLEFKSVMPEFEKLIKTCIAFANGSGGQILIGIQDGTREVIGATDKDRDRLYDEFPNSLYDSVSPTLLSQIYEKRICDKSVLVIHVLPSPKKPYFLKKEGFPKGIYVRIGSNTRRANQEYAEDLIREGNRLYFDEEHISENIDILSKDLLKQFYKKPPDIKRLLLDKVITGSSLAPGSYYPTVTGILFFALEPHLYLPEAVIMCTSFKGNSGRDIIQTRELTGPIDTLAEESVSLIESWISRDYKLQGVKLERESIVPKKALREAVINALIHRKYSIPGSIKIHVYEEHIDIISPGGFPGLVDLHNLGDGTSFLRNPHLARLAHKAHLVERLGTGVQLIFDSCRQAGLPLPSYFEGNDLIKLRFYLEKEMQEKRPSSEGDMIAFLKLHKEISIQDAMNILRVSRNTATRALSKLMKQGKITRVGKGPSVRYQLL